MKVGLVLQQFDPPRGGLEQWTSRFAQQLIERGHEVHVVAERFGEETRTMSMVAHQVPRAPTRIAFAQSAQEALLSFGPDVIHDMGAGWFCDVFQPHVGSWKSMIEQKSAMFPPWMRRLKSHIDQWLPRQRDYEALLSGQYADNGQIFVALSRSVAEDFRRLHGVPEDRIRLIYNGVDTTRFAPKRRNRFRDRIRRWLGIADNQLLLLVVTHNFRLKGVPTLLRAMAQLRRRGVPVHLAVVGGKRPGSCVGEARRLGVERSVTFVGAVNDTVPYYAAADVYVHPTFYDACSLVVLEALASGLPVVTTHSNGAAELLSEGVEGHVMSHPAAVDELVGHVQALCDADTRRRMGGAARRLAMKHTLQRNVDQVLAVYEEVVRSREGHKQRRGSLIRNTSLLSAGSGGPQQRLEPT